MKFIDNPFEFFIMNDYNFSLFWAIFWFALVFFISLKLTKSKLINYLDWIVVSFLFISIIWYIGAFLGWQIYWKEVSWALTSIWVSYDNPFSNVPYEVPIFPLAIVYSLISFILFSVLYILSMFINIKWLIWYIWLIIFSSSLLILETFNWDPDTFKILFNINLTQICSIILILLSFYWLKLLYKDKNIKKHKINI